MLNQVADGVWVRQSAWVLSNAIAVRGEGGLILVDPGIDGSELNQLADDLDRLGIPVVAGFSTHPHWDHLLWHPRFGDVPRYATPAGARAASEARERAQRMAAESASGIPLELIGLVTPLPADGGPVPGEIVEHQAHAIGHAAVLLADRGVLLAGDMLSDVLIPLLDPRRPGQVGAYEAALDRLDEAARHVDVLVPGHGAVAEGPEVAARLAADHAYIDALRRGEEPVDARLGPELALRHPPVEPGAGPWAVGPSDGSGVPGGSAVDRLSFVVEPGVVTGFLGPNGAGKSTTMRMIAGLDRPTSGTMRVNGLDPDGVRWIRLLLKSLAAEGRTVFVSSHLMSEMAQTATRLVVLGRSDAMSAVTRRPGPAPARPPQRDRSPRYAWSARSGPSCGRCARPGGAR